MKKEENKELGVKWLHFLYGWFIFQCVMSTLSILSIIFEISTMKKYYGSAYTVYGITYVVIFISVIGIIVKIGAYKNQCTEKGYTLFVGALCIDAISLVINGFSNNALTGVIASFAALATWIPNYIYVKKRKCLFADEMVNKIAQEASKENGFVEKCGVALSNEYTEPQGIVAEEPADDAKEQNDEILTPMAEQPTTGEAVTQADPLAENEIFIPQPQRTGPENEALYSYCRKCGAKLFDDSEFCHECGEKVARKPLKKIKFCRKCGRELVEEVNFCPKCGTEVIRV